MTSEFTLAPTQDFFKENQCFGLEPSNVIMFEQRMIPAVTLEGKMILQDKGKVAMAPGGCPRPSAPGARPAAFLNICLLDQMETEGCTRHWRTTRFCRTWSGGGWSTCMCTAWTTSSSRWPTRPSSGSV